MDITELVAMARELESSDIHLTVGLDCVFRIHGQLAPSGLGLGAEASETLILSMCTDTQRTRLRQGDDLDFAFTTAGNLRQRVNIFQQQGRLAAAIRLLHPGIPTLTDLQLPSIVGQLTTHTRGLILITGPTGSGKSTTLAAMVDAINRTRAAHLITIEDPIEYQYHSQRATIHQREVGIDTPGFAQALKSALREDPDVILVGEMRDYATIAAAVTAAETGHLVLSSLHTTGASQTIDRIVDACPAASQGQMRSQLAAILQGIVTQQLVPLAHADGRIAATEILLATSAVRNLIRENKCHQLATVMQSSAALGMHTLDGDLARLVRTEKISREIALQYATNPAELADHELAAHWG